MDLKELEQWVSTEEGRTWLDGHKKPLLDKRDELLSDLKAGNARLAELAQRAADSEKLLAEERQAIRRIVVDDGLAAALKQANVNPTSVPGLVAELRESNAFDVQSNGLERKALGAGGKDIGAAVAEWLGSPVAKFHVLAPVSNGGGAEGGRVQGSQREMSFTAFNALDAGAKMGFFRDGGKIVG